MKRREVWWVSFDPSIGGEIKKKRPAVIVSNDASNKFLNRVQIVPLTSKTDRLYPSEALVLANRLQRRLILPVLDQSFQTQIFKIFGSVLKWRP